MGVALTCIPWEACTTQSRNQSPVYGSKERPTRSCMVLPRASSWNRVWHWQNPCRHIVLRYMLNQCSGTKHIRPTTFGPWKVTCSVQDRWLSRKVHENTTKGFWIILTDIPTHRSSVLTGLSLSAAVMNVITIKDNDNVISAFDYQAPFTVHIRRETDIFGA